MSVELNHCFPIFMLILIFTDFFVQEEQSGGRVCLPLQMTQLSTMSFDLDIWRAGSVVTALSDVNNRRFTEFFLPLLPHPSTDRNETRTWYFLSP